MTGLHRMMHLKEVITEYCGLGRTKLAGGVIFLCSDKADIVLFCFERDFNLI